MERNLFPIARLSNYQLFKMQKERKKKNVLILLHSLLTAFMMYDLLHAWNFPLPQALNVSNRFFFRMWFNLFAVTIHPLWCCWPCAEKNCANKVWCMFLQHACLVNWWHGEIMRMNYRLRLQQPHSFFSPFLPWGQLCIFLTSLPLYLAT